MSKAQIRGSALASRSGLCSKTTCPPCRAKPSMRPQAGQSRRWHRQPVYSPSACACMCAMHVMQNSCWLSCAAVSSANLHIQWQLARPLAQPSNDMLCVTRRHPGSRLRRISGRQSNAIHECNAAFPNNKKLLWQTHKALAHVVLGIPGNQCTDHDDMLVLQNDVHACIAGCAVPQKDPITFAVTLNQWPQRTPASMQKRM